MFAIYVMEIAQIANLEKVGTQYLVLFVWGLFGIYLINPFPIFNWNSRLYAFKLVLKSLFSPFLGVIFPVIWMTDQAISLVTPLKDFAYTICYYQNIDFTKEFSVDQNKCSSSTRV